MAYTSLATVLQHLGQTSEWQRPQQFLRLLEQWPQIVGALMAQQSFPVDLNDQGVLTVAVASSTWAHHLTFSRAQLLAKIQQTLGIALRDIHFSHRYWSASRRTTVLGTTPQLPRVPLVSPTTHPAKTPHEAFQRWRQHLEERSRTLGRCPACQCPTPAQELQRWGVCGLCHVRRSPA